jgi:heme oxygenase
VRAFIVGDPRGRIWQQHDETLEAFEKRVEAEANALHHKRGLHYAFGRFGFYVACAIAASARRVICAR